MASQLQSFTNDMFGTIRTITDRGQILFCGRDVATALGYQDPTNAVKLHCRGVANYHPIEDALGRTQNARFITEGDLYRLIISSKLPAAEVFEAWGFDEVLPSIRRHGLYAIDELLGNDEFLEQAIAARLAVSRDQIRAYVTRTGIEPTAKADPDGLWCRWCGIKLPQRTDGKKPSFCCSKHRRAFWHTPQTQAPAEPSMSSRAQTVARPFKRMGTRGVSTAVTPAISATGSALKAGGNECGCRARF